MKNAWMWFGGFTAVFAVSMVYVFWGTWSPDVTFVQPDCATAYSADVFAAQWREFCAGGALVPWDLRVLLGGPYLLQEFQYAFAAYLAALGVVYYLRGRGLPFAACYGAGSAYGFMGYNLTLYSAGHLGWFALLACAPFCFGLIDRCVRKGKMLNWVLLGGLLAWGGARQPDIWLLFTVFSFAYGLFRFLQDVISRKDAGERRQVAVRVLLGVAVSVTVMFAAGWPQLYTAVFVNTASRDKQIEQSTGAVDDAGPGKNEASEEAKREKRYVFCTNWSLPPDETLEFLIPGIKGASSDPRVSPKDRYSGRIGMQVAPGRWAPYRQHSLYMGFLTVCLAVFGTFGAMRRRKEERPRPDGVSNRAETVFWTVSAAVLLLVSFGGFTPFYRIVFALPAGDYIRCPVKFVHLVEWCVAVLAGFGAARILSSGAARKAPRAAVLALTALFAANLLNLAVEAAKYLAVDPGDTIRIAIAKETGSTSLGFAMDAKSQWGEDAYLLAGGTAFRDNARLKDALSKGEYSPVSFWSFRSGRLVKTSREQASFALLKSSEPPPKRDGPSVPGASAIVSLLASGMVCVVLALKPTCRRRWPIWYNPRRKKET